MNISTKEGNAYTLFSCTPRCSLYLPTTFYANIYTCICYSCEYIYISYAYVIITITIYIYDESRKAETCL